MPSKDSREPSVLIVDDEESIRKVARLTLELAEFSVFEAEDGLKAVELLRELKPDLILLDVMLPGLDGIGVCRELRKMPGREGIPVLMITGLDDIESIIKAYAAGATDFITKPLNWVILGHRLMYMLRASETFSELMMSETKNRALLNALPDGMFQIDRSGILLDFKAAPDLDLIAQTGEVLGKQLQDVLPEELAGRIREALEDAFNTRETQIFEYVVTRLGADHYFELRVVVCGEDAVLALIRDITERKHAEHDIRYMAYHDSLTQLPNIQSFKDHLGLALSSAEHSGKYFAVFFIDLDRFKQINDTYGHKVGDLLLKASADRIINGMRRSDIVAHVNNENVHDMVARMGGDEFTILLPNIRKPEDIAKVSQRILEELSEPFLISSHELNITGSLGIAMYPNDGDDIDSLLQNADTAMYHAKVKGRNNFQFFDESMNLHIKERLSVENRIRKALEDKEFRLKYLPRYEMKSGRILGVEALLRWNPHDIFNVPVEQVIAIAGDMGVIASLGHWILQTACSQAAEWQKDDLCQYISVNISIHEFRNNDLAAKIRKLTNDTGLKPCCLELEITESIIMQDVGTTTSILKSLKELGVRISIDDFGTGNSSLSLLRSLPIDFLKIAQVLTRNLTTDSDSAAVVKAIIAIAHSLDLKAVGEGVETEEQYRFLSDHGCDEFQGFRYSQAVTADEMTTLLMKQKHTGPECFPGGKDGSKDLKVLK